MPAYYQFPPQNDPYEKEIPVWMNFYISLYSTFNRNRTRAAVQGNAQTVVSIPYPRSMSTLNSQNYTAGGSLNVQSIETGSLLGTLGQQISATKELASSFFSGGGVIRFDHFETVLEPGARRTHAFDINLVAKNEKQAKMASTIGLIFQTNVFPLAATQSLLTMLHPPLWYFEASGHDKTIVPDYWDGNPLPCVLKSVDINRSPILNTPFTTPNFRPLAINIKLVFIELEPAMQPGNGDLTLLSRAERFIGGSRVSPPRGEWT
jgi:hypothetical protein